MDIVNMVIQWIVNAIIYIFYGGMVVYFILFVIVAIYEFINLTRVGTDKYEHHDY